MDTENQMSVFLIEDNNDNALLIHQFPAARCRKHACSL
jgi:hypothetical protein